MPDLLDEAISEAMAQLEAAPETPAPPAVEVDDGQAEPEAEGNEELEAPATDDTADEAEPDDAEPEGDPDDSEESEHEEDDGTEVVEPVEVADTATYRLPDGTEVSGTELKDGWLRHADYTRKTQEVAAQRQEVQTLQQQMVDWYEERASNPAAWINEIASETDNPIATLAEAIEAERDPTNAAASLLVKLAERGKLDEQFVKRFGLEEYAGKAGAYEADTKLSRIERQLQEEREAREASERTAAEAARTQTLVAEYQRQWASIVQSEGLTYDSPQAETEAKFEVMRFARDNEIPNLEHAYAAYARSRPQPARPKVDARKAVERKRQSRAVSPKAPPAGPAPRKPGDIEAAMREAAGELGMTHLT